MKNVKRIATMAAFSIVFVIVPAAVALASKYPKGRP